MAVEIARPEITSEVVLFCAVSTEEMDGFFPVFREDVAAIWGTDQSWFQLCFKFKVWTYTSINVWNVLSINITNNDILLIYSHENQRQRYWRGYHRCNTYEFAYVSRKTNMLYSPCVLTRSLVCANCTGATAEECTSAEISETCAQNVNQCFEVESFNIVTLSASVVRGCCPTTSCDAICVTLNVTSSGWLQSCAFLWCNTSLCNSRVPRRTTTPAPPGSICK